MNFSSIGDIIRAFGKTSEISNEIASSKDWYASKTTWFHILNFLAWALATFFHGDLGLSDQEITDAALFLSTFGGLILRKFTKNAIHFKKPVEEKKDESV